MCIVQKRIRNGRGKKKKKGCEEGEDTFFPLRSYRSPVTVFPHQKKMEKEKKTIVRKRVVYNYFWFVYFYACYVSCFCFYLPFLFSTGEIKATSKSVREETNPVARSEANGLPSSSVQLFSHVRFISFLFLFFNSLSLLFVPFYKRMNLLFDVCKLNNTKRTTTQQPK